jgi:CheY-like chemotaxis protein
MRILVVDDCEDARDLAEGVLLSAGFDEVFTADSGSQALDILEIFRTPKGRSTIDIVLLDFSMPQWTASRSARASARTHALHGVADYYVDIPRRHGFVDKRIRSRRY